MKKIFTIVLFILLSFSYSMTFDAGFSATNSSYLIEYVSKDKYVLQSNLSIPSTKKSKYPLVVMLHSWGLSSKYWGNLPKDLLKEGYAVLEVDLRGHGKSNTLDNSKQISYMYLSKKSILQIPNDVYQILSQVYSSYSNLSKKEVYFIGADIGASAAIMVAKNIGITPGAMVLISPQINFKGIYIPNTFLELGEVPILSVASKKDPNSISQIQILKKYAQGDFSFLKLPNGGPGMLCVSANIGADSAIVTWLKQKTPSLKK